MQKNKLICIKDQGIFVKLNLCVLKLWFDVYGKQYS